MLHPDVLAELLDEELAAARLRCGPRLAGGVRQGVSVIVEPATWGGRKLKLQGANYDAMPPDFSILDAGDNELPGAQWPAGIYGGEHPVLHRPWACIQGTLGYHTYPQHAPDSWDKYRSRFRIPELIEKILLKTGG